MERLTLECSMPTSNPLPVFALVRERNPSTLIFAVDDVGAQRARLESLGVPILQRSWQEQSEACDCVDAEDKIFRIAARVRLPDLFGNMTPA